MWVNRPDPKKTRSLVAVAQRLVSRLYEIIRSPELIFKLPSEYFFLRMVESVWHFEENPRFSFYQTFKPHIRNTVEKRHCRKNALQVLAPRCSWCSAFFTTNTTKNDASPFLNVVHVARHLRLEALAIYEQSRTPAPTRCRHKLVFCFASNSTLFPERKWN